MPIHQPRAKHRLNLLSQTKLQSLRSQLLQSMPLKHTLRKVEVEVEDVEVEVEDVDVEVEVEVEATWMRRPTGTKKKQRL